MIQVTLHANEFEHVGTYDNRNYTSLRIQRISNSRVYFFTIQNGMKMNTMAKKMQLDNGKVYVSFGKQGKLYIGTYVDTEATEKTPQETPSNEMYQNESLTLDIEKCLQVIFCEASSTFLMEHYDISIEELNNTFSEHVDMIKNKLNTMTEKEIIGFIEFHCTLESLDSHSINELYQSSIKADKQNNIQKSNPTIQVTKQKESILIRGYMGKVEQVEAYKINHHELELYLYKSSKYYAIYEKNTGKSVIGTKPTKKEAINQLKQLLNDHYNKLKAAIQSTIEKDGCISNYKIGAWIKSA